MNRNTRPLVGILGINEIASAVGVHLLRAGWAIVLLYDPFPPVVRRGMAFHDVLFGDRRVIDGIEGERAESLTEIAAALAIPNRVAVTPLQLADLVARRRLDALVDARMQKRRITPDLRGAAGMTVGLGPLFRVGMNCDVAVETKPVRNGCIVTTGSTDEADGVSSRLGDVGPERFVYSERSGRWHTPVDIGDRTFHHFVLGHLDGRPVHAPLDGIVRGIVRDGLHVPEGVKLIEIDPRGRDAKWIGIDDRGRGIAVATVKAIQLKLRQPAVWNSFGTSLATFGEQELRSVV